MNISRTGRVQFGTTSPPSSTSLMVRMRMSHFYQFSSDQFIAEAIVLHLQQLIGGDQIGGRHGNLLLVECLDESCAGIDKRILRV